LTRVVCIVCTSATMSVVRSHSPCETSTRSRASRWLSVGAIGLSIAVPSSGAAADAAGTAACVRSYEQAQRLRRDAKLRSAMSELATCEQVCPPALRTDCEQWRADTDRRIPSIVVSAWTASGRTLIAVRVIADEQLLSTRLDGQALPLDPGEHTLRFETDGAPVLREQVVLSDGEKQRPVMIRFASPPADESGSAPTAERHGISAGVYAAGTLSVLGLVGAAYFGVRRASEIDSLDRCRPSCASSDVESANLDLALAAGSLFVAVAGAAVAAYLQLVPRSPAAPAASFRGPVLVVSPQWAGLAATLATRF
jgi:hypothetical protein